jgi:fluoride exporter
VDYTPLNDAATRATAAVGEDLPIDPDVLQADRVPTSPGRRSTAGPTARRRAQPTVLWSQLSTALVRRRDVLGVIAVGGVLGSLARWGLAEALPHRPDEFPWATFGANVSGCFLIGLLMVFVIEVWPPSRYLRPFLGVGILGGYTTFSTYMLDTRALLVSGDPRLAGVYLFGSLAAGFTCVWLAVFAARGLVRLSRRRRHRRHEREAQGRAGPAGRRADPVAPDANQTHRKSGPDEAIGANGAEPSDPASRRTS